MHTINATLLQTPIVLSDGEPILFPYKKAEALFYYLAVEKTVTRETISYLLWEDADSETALKNLRHALYTIKKLFGYEVITSAKKTLLTINSEINFKCDLDELVINGTIHCYVSDFLTGFFIKNSSSFEEWLEEKRENIKSHYLIKLYEYIRSIPYDKISDIELNCMAYMKVDPYDERIVSLLIEAYYLNKLYLKGIKAYQKLHKELGEELGIVPGQDITNLYRQLRTEWAETSTIEENTDSFVVRGRKTEALLLKNIYQNFVNGKVQVALISGENGIGKSYLIHSLCESVKSDHLLILTTNCYSQERGTLLYPWNSILLQLDDYMQNHDIKIPATYIQTVAQFFPTFGNQIPVVNSVSFDVSNTMNLRAVYNGIFRILSLITEQIPVMLIFDNLHFGDHTSRYFITNMVQDLHKNFMAIITALEPFDTEMLEFIGGIQKENLLIQIHLNRFTKEDVQEIISSFPGISQLTPAPIDKIYEETAGNAFFLIELLNTYKERGELTELSMNAQSILAQRLSDLTTTARQILDIISLFHDYASLDLLERVFGASSLELMNALDELKMRALIKEKLVHNEIQFSFTHSKMRDYVNSQIPPSKQRVLSNSIANTLEQLLSKNDASFYNKLIHYFTLAGNTVKTLTYQIYQFEDISTTLFELYPSQLSSDSLQTPDNLLQYFEEIEKKLIDCKNQFYDSELYEELYARLLIAKGRYCIMSGLYYDGITSIKESFLFAYVKKNPSYLLRAYRQMVYYGIQLYQPNLMQEYILKGLTLSMDHEMWLEYALFLRLNGLFDIMQGDYNSCYDHLKKSISVLENNIIPVNTRVINISAAYNYMGEMERKQKHFSSAINYYKKAVDLCLKHNITLIATYYTNLGLAYQEDNQTKLAYDNFLVANEIYDNSFTLMGRSITKGYCSMYYSEQGKFDQARALLASAWNAVNQLGSPIEQSIVEEITSRLKSTYPVEFA